MACRRDDNGRPKFHVYEVVKGAKPAGTTNKGKRMSQE